ncbi:hypothetical protein I4U23_020304 [Adineta vaga]|nr:hypothetical protein I4U23_020304 [Adineta vaga]
MTTAKGTLLALGEARMFTCHDNTQIDIVYKRSSDNRKTWSNLELKYNQRILIPFCRNNLIIMQTYSDDDGLTFTPPQIIPNITRSEWKWSAIYWFCHVKWYIGGITFDRITILNTLVQPLRGCEDSTLYHSNTRHLFYSGLAEVSTTRTNLSLHISKDNGENWGYIKTICPGSSSYSSLTTLIDQSIGILYEKGSTMGAPDSLTFTIVYNQTKKEYV